MRVCQFRHIRVGNSSSNEREYDLFFDVGVKAFFASFCASFASTYCFSTTRVIESNQGTLILIYEVVEYRRSCYIRREGKEYETGIINKRQLLKQCEWINSLVYGIN